MPQNGPMLISEVFSVLDRGVIVTGASSGLGERFARVLATNGARVLAVARRGDRLEALASEVQGVVPCVADLAAEPGRERVIETAHEALGGVDVLINNAGYGEATPALDETVTDFRRVLEIDLVAVFELSRLAARVMIAAGGGSIINIASVAGLVATTPLPNASYTAAKGGVVSLTRELGCQWARRGVRVNAIAPGFFLTKEDMKDPRFGDFVGRQCPMGRFGRADELDGVVLFLASGASSYCTGGVFSIDGGWTAR
jgi:NAD(P)-dependent dehydrogenase (short-subunit alcohol dehydrogenase family)